MRKQESIIACYKNGTPFGFDIVVIAFIIGLCFNFVKAYSVDIEDAIDRLLMWAATS
jgi:uncharacterized membrane protein (DUF106 family)